MPNQLRIQFKNTQSIPIKDAVREYIETNHTDTHPDAFKWDIAQWEALRKDGVGGVVQLSRVKASLSYHAQLVFILTKLPLDIGLEFPYYPAFHPEYSAFTVPNLAYERVCVLFNLGALHSQLASSEDRSSVEGLKRAIAHFQSAAGTFNWLIKEALPTFLESLQDARPPSDLTEAFLRSLEYLMLAQAQECFWQKAVADTMRNGIIAKLAAKVSSLYASSLSQIESAVPSVNDALPTGWIQHLQTKIHHFAAAAQYRKSIDELEMNEYGAEIARLTLAESSVKKGLDTSRYGVAKPVREDILSLQKIIQRNLLRANKDNDLIYHQDVPSGPSLAPIAEAAMVQSLVPSGLRDPKTVAGSEFIFGTLVGWGVRKALEIYRYRRENWLREEVFDQAKTLDGQATQALNALNLPASLEALEKPIGLPPSLVRMADEVRLEKGPDRINALVDDIEILSKRDSDILDEALDILDQEATEDESYREAFAVDVWTRPPSHEANVELTGKASRFRDILTKAAESDRHIREKFEDWEKEITVLSWQQADIEKVIPSTTFTPGSTLSANASQTQAHARALRALLEGLDDLQRSRKQFVQRAERLVDADDIRSRIMKEAVAMEQWVEVKPELFEDSLDEELEKYHKFKIEIEEGGRKQEELLARLKERNTKFLQSRKDDPTVKERENAFQNLNLAYHRYREVLAHLEEALKFYNDFASILTQFRDECKSWVYQRREDITWLTQSLNDITIESDTTVDRQTSKKAPTPVVDLTADEPDSSPSSPEHKSPASEVTPTAQKAQGPPVARRTAPPIAFELPPPDSDAWEQMAIPVQAATTSSRSQVKTPKKRAAR